MIYVAVPSENIDLIFYKLMFYFDKFQPGKIRYWNVDNKHRKPILPFDIDIPMDDDNLKIVAIKSNEADDCPVICMARITIPETTNDAIIISFPLIAYTPQLIIRHTETGIGLGCDDGGHDLSTDMSKTEEREAFNFFIEKVKNVIAECTGN